MERAPGICRNGRILNRLRQAAVLCVLALVMAGPAVGGPEHELRTGVVDVIKDQLAAFQRDDGRAAFSIASPEVQDQFGTPEAYLADAHACRLKATLSIQYSGNKTKWETHVEMDAYLAKIATTYRAVYRPKSVMFLNLAFSRGRLVQRVLLVGPDGNPVVALFPMIRMDDGSWRVDGCVLVPATGKSASSEPKSLDKSGSNEIAAIPE